MYLPAIWASNWYSDLLVYSLIQPEKQRNKNKLNKLQTGKDNLPQEQQQNIISAQKNRKRAIMKGLYVWRSCHCVNNRSTSEFPYRLHDYNHRATVTERYNGRHLTTWLYPCGLWIIRFMKKIFYVIQNNGNLSVHSERDLNPVCQRTVLLYGRTKLSDNKA